MAKSKNNDKVSNADDNHERIIKEMISKEILKKIEKRIDSNDEKVLKTFKQIIDDDKRKF